MSRARKTVEELTDHDKGMARVDQRIALRATGGQPSAECPKCGGLGTVHGTMVGDPERLPCPLCNGTKIVTHEEERAYWLRVDQNQAAHRAEYDRHYTQRDSDGYSPAARAAQRNLR